MRTLKTITWLFALLSTCSNMAYADPHSDGISLGKSQLGSLNGNISTTNAQKAPFYSNNPPQASSFGGPSLITLGTSRISSCKTAVHGSDAVANQECDAVNFLAKNPNNRVRMNVSSSDPIVSAMTQTINNAQLGSITDNGCVQKTTTTPDQHSTEVCNEYYLANDKLCSMGQVVQVDADSNYQCNVTISAYETLKCRKSTNITCSGGGDGCDAGGIIPGSWAGDMAVNWTAAGGGNYILQFGTIAEDYWGGWGAVYDRTLTFSVKDVNLITLSALTYAAFDDWLLVKVNGYLVYVGPKGGDRLEITPPPSTAMASGTMCYQNDYGSGYTCSTWTGGYRGYYVYTNWAYCELRGTSWDGSGGTYYCGAVAPGQVQYCSNCYSSPELSTSWRIPLNIDIKPYLVNGTNTIFMRTIVAGGGEGAIQITTRQKCPVNCSLATDNQCAPLEARAL